MVSAASVLPSGRMNAPSVGTRLAAVLLAGGLAAAGCGPSGDRTPLGVFDLYTQAPRSADARPRVSLYYKRRLLTNRYGTSALDPRGSGRILFSGDTEFSSDKDPCGTFLFDAATGRLDRIAAWPDGLGAWSWSPDGQKALLGGYAGVTPEVVDLGSRESVPLVSAVSQNGAQLEMHALGWSPDSERIAAVIHVPRGADGEQDWDLVELTLSPLAAAYVATKHATRATWDAIDYRWQDGRLSAVGAGRGTPTTRKADDDLGWTASPPDQLTRSQMTCQ